MPPYRRKGKASSAAAAAAAAARRQWKVGDLVLAKVKGFPAWPATVSEPEKWGYSADWKKVLVYFFGTNQIAFCNPADVEAFTEEKKESLLVKRQGRGADFVRAVQEIIVSYEKSKLHDRADDFNSGDEVIVTNVRNSVDSLASSGPKDHTEASSGTLISRLNSSGSTGDRDDVSLPAEDDVATKLDASHDRETSSEQPTDDAVVTETPLLTTSRKSFGDIQPQCRITQKRAPSVRRSRTSSRADLCRFQNFIVPSNAGGKSVGALASNITRDGSMRRNKRMRKSTDASERHDSGSPNFVSNCSIEDNGSEIVTVDSDSLSFNEGSTLESGCNLEHVEAAEGLEGEIELSKRLDLQIKAVVNKKKRKPTRKRTTNEAARFADGLEQVACLMAGVHETRLNSPDACDKSKDRSSKEVGDEHLPLVKRARVRMGKQSAAVEGFDSMIKIEDKSPKEVRTSLNCLDGSAADKNSLVATGTVEALDSIIKIEDKPSKEVCIPFNCVDSSAADRNSLVATGSVDSIIKEVCTSLNCLDGSASDRNSLVVMGITENPSPINNCVHSPGNRSEVSKVKKSQSLGSVDVEAALPPSKRLHRALEAMSANAADDVQACNEAPPTRGNLSDVRCVSSSGGDPQMFIENEVLNDLEVQNNISFVNNPLEEHISATLGPQISVETQRFSIDVNVRNQLVGSPKSIKDDVETVVHTQSLEPLWPNLVRRQASPRANQGLLDKFSPKDKCISENFELSHSRAEIPEVSHSRENADKSVDPSEHTGTISKIEKDVEFSSQNDTNVLLDQAEGNCCENTKHVEPPVDDNGEVRGMCEIVKGVKHKLFRTSDNLVKDSVRGSHSCENDVSIIRSSPSPANGSGSPFLASAPSTSPCNMTTTDKSHFQGNGSCSPEVHLHHDKNLGSLDAEGKSDPVVTYVGKSGYHAEANAALASFETMLKTLTRGKECILRATRFAIDSAKFGIASKMVGILVRSLESESSLHRRVDLFFLVDSITQSSRGVRGTIGGTYLSAIQSALPRLLSAAAPPGEAARENRRQCLKVLRLWLERKILPESVIRHHMRHLDSLCNPSSSVGFSRRMSRTERAFDDPLREMEGMLVDEYGSNSSFQLPGFCMPRMRKDEDDGSDSDGGGFEAVTPEHNSDNNTPPEESEPTPKAEKHRHILEDVDGELEMEDVAPSEVEMSSATKVNGGEESFHYKQHFSSSFPPPLPNDMAPSSPPLPSSPPPPPPPPPPPRPHLPVISPVPSRFSNGLDSKIYMNMRDELQQQIVSSEPEPSVSDGLRYHGPSHRDFGSYPAISHPAIRSVNNVPHSDGGLLHDKAYHHLQPPQNNVPQTDGGLLHDKAYHLRPTQNNVPHTDGALLHDKAYHHLRPPHPRPSNQFSYIQVDPPVHSRREAPPCSYSNRFHFSHRGISESDHDRMKFHPHELGDNWRFSERSIPGPLYPEKFGGSFGPDPYMGPSREATRMPNHGWSLPPRPNHRNSMPIRPSIEGTSYWGPR